MVISIKNLEDRIVIDIHSEELEGFVVNTLRSTLNDLIKRNQVNILINFSQVGFICSSVLGCLVSAQKKCRRRGGQISIYGVQPDILMIFYIIRLDEYINLYNSELDAVNHQNILVRRRLRLVKG